MIFVMIFFLFFSMMCNPSHSELKTKLEESQSKISELQTKQTETTRALDTQTEALNQLNKTILERFPAR